MTLVEKVNRIYRIVERKGMYVLVDCIGQPYGEYTCVEAARSYANHLTRAEIAQKREMLRWDGKQGY